jgi:predicted glycosyltransferase
MLGGGEDGAFLAESFADASLPPGTAGVILCGPHLPEDVIDRLLTKAAAREGGASPLHVCRFVARPDELIAGAERVVAMGGYNTVWEVLSYGKPCLLAPRVAPRREQWIRARRLADLGLVDVIAPDDLSAAAVSKWLARAPSVTRSARDVLDMGGMARLPHLLSELLSGGGGDGTDSTGPAPAANGITQEVLNGVSAGGGAHHARA